MRISSQSHNGHNPLPCQRSRPRERDGSPRESAYSLRLDEVGASAKRPMLVRPGRERPCPREAACSPHEPEAKAIPCRPAQICPKALM
jgi:hypothetical protein